MQIARHNAQLSAIFLNPINLAPHKNDKHSALK